MENPNKLKFLNLKYNVSEIDEMISTYDDINNFVFSYYATEPYTGLQLVAFARLGTDCNNVSYAPETNILTPYGDESLIPTGPVILSDNVVSIAQMKILINKLTYQNNKRPDYLVFTPAISSAGHLYYLIQGSSNDELLIGSDPTPTNPSPPATIII